MNPGIKTVLDLVEKEQIKYATLLTEAFDEDDPGTIANLCTEAAKSIAMELSLLQILNTMVSDEQQRAFRRKIGQKS